MSNQDKKRPEEPPKPRNHSDMRPSKRPENDLNGATTAIDRAGTAGVVPDFEAEGSQARVALLIDRLDELVRESGIAPRLRDYGIDIAEAPMLAREAMKQARLLINNPCEITEADAQRLYEAAW